ncbi:hypothetical protein NDU88_000847 [Pleurodeles waltl]|uniref:Uncharacterized protein n=1 Tax=Pleurodeles waltl TaxID=8319 RepID=A0AAV7UT15_PLEWA|nr:hypothetical protein NDU88_000847 [Pleurodeles waltl]
MGTGREVGKGGEVVHEERAWALGGRYTERGGKTRTGKHYEHKTGDCLERNRVSHRQKGIKRENPKCKEKKTQEPKKNEKEERYTGNKERKWPEGKPKQTGLRKDRRQEKKGKSRTQG